MIRIAYNPNGFAHPLEPVWSYSCVFAAFLRYLITAGLMGTSKLSTLREPGDGDDGRPALVNFTFEY